MLTREENELLCRVGPGAPMGAMLRRYWIPALLSEEIVAGGAPKRIRLLGEDLVAFRDHSGRPGILDENCPHRGASLVLARNEGRRDGDGRLNEGRRDGDGRLNEGRRDGDGCGLRCLYHGWKIDVTGAVLETPAEPDESTFRDKVRAIAYPVREAGGFVWAYLGPAGLEPQFPAFEFTGVPAERRIIMKAQSDCNWAQTLEGVIDSAHTNVLHADGITPAQVATTVYAGGTAVVRPSNDGRPRIEIENTGYGFRYAAIRRPTVDAERQKYVRVSLFVAPFYGIFPAPAGWSFMQAFVPIDDQRTMLHYIQVKAEGTIDAATRERNAHRAGMRPGIDLDANYNKVQHRTNNWMQDRAAMARGEAFSGIFGVQNQDMAVQESMGRIYDRTKEHLGTSDVAVIRMRRQMLESLQRCSETGAAPLGLAEPVAYPDLRAEELMLPLDAPALGPGHAQPIQGT